MYSSKDLVHAYLGIRHSRFSGYHPESPTYNDALESHYLSLLEGLQQLFGLRLHLGESERSQNPILTMLFRSTVDSILSLRTPWSDYLEVGLLHTTLEKTGEPGTRVNAASARIRAFVDDAREAHLEMLDALIAAMVGERADVTFTDDDVLAAGISIIAKPSTNDYPLYDA